LRLNSLPLGEQTADAGAEQRANTAPDQCDRSHGAPRIAPAAFADFDAKRGRPREQHTPHEDAANEGTVSGGVASQPQRINRRESDDWVRPRKP